MALYFKACLTPDNVITPGVASSRLVPTTHTKTGQFRSRRRKATIHLRRTRSSGAPPRFGISNVLWRCYLCKKPAVSGPWHGYPLDAPGLTSYDARRDVSSAPRH